MIDPVAELGPWGGLERWLAQPDVTEVMVNAGRDVWIERHGRLELVGQMRSSTVLAVVEQMLMPLGRRLDRMHPTVDARLPDGARLCAVIEPIAVDGPCLTIRRGDERRLTLDAFALPEVAGLATELVRRRCNVIISGATSSGKTTLLRALAHHVGPDQRLVTLEDVAELRLDHRHVVRLETRDRTPDGVGEVTLADLVRAALRMRPDRLVVGEVRGAEALHLLHALNTGHDGSLSTVHANSALDALDRLASLVLLGAPSWPPGEAHRLVSRAVDVVVHTERTARGGRRIAEIAEVVEGERVALVPLATHDRVVGVLRRGRP
ncbi:MAG: CpaF family protein [Ilumatobacteraceae bacterium]